MYALIAILGVTTILSRKHICAVLFAVAFFISIYNPALLSKNTEAVRVCGCFCLGAIAQLYKDKLPIRHEVMLLLCLQLGWVICLGI